MGYLKDIIGNKYGYLTVLSICPVKKGRSGTTWLCKCKCGKTKIILGKTLKNGDTKSCGCYHVKRLKEANTKHGMSCSKEFSIWADRKQACTNNKHVDYPRFGGIGIKFYDPWLTFKNFINDMGVKPSPKHTLQRINPDGDFEPLNCKWGLGYTKRRKFKKSNSN